MIEQQVSISHRNSVDICKHRGLMRNILRVKYVGHFIHNSIQRMSIRNISKIQVISRKTDLLVAHTFEKLCAKLFIGIFKEITYTEPRFAVPTKLLIFRLTQQLQRRMDIVLLT